MKRINFSLMIILAVALGGCEAMNWPKPPVSATRSSRPLVKMPTPSGLLTSTPTQLPAPVPSNVFSIEDILTQESLGAYAISPDGSMVVWERTSPAEANGSRLRLTQLKDGSTKPVSDDKYVESAPVWSADGKWVAFISSRPMTQSEQGGIFLLNIASKEIQPLLIRPEGLGVIAWRDRTHVLFTADDPANVPTSTEGDSVIVAESGVNPAVQLFQIDIEGGQIERLTNNADVIQAVSASVDGKRIFTQRVGKPHDSWRLTDENLPTFWLMEMHSAKEVQLFGDVLSAQASYWASDGSSMMLVEKLLDSKGNLDVGVGQVRFMDINTAKDQVLPLDWDRGIQLQTDPDRHSLGYFSGGFLALMANGARPLLARYTLDGGKWTRTMVEGENQGNIFSFDLSRDGKTIVYEFSTASAPPQLYTATLEGNRLINPRKISDLNPNISQKKIATREVISWEGAGEETIEGILRYPTDYQADRRYPLILVIHPGPAQTAFDAWDETWIFPHQLLNQKGAFTLTMNYHGSLGYGMSFATSVKDGKFLELPLLDLQAGINEMAKRGMIDNNRIGVMGWSYGASLAYWLADTNPRVQAGSCTAGNVEWISTWGGSKTGDQWLTYYMGGNPLDLAQRYQDLSSMNHAAGLNGSLIIFQGEKDTLTPATAAWTAYRSYYTASNAPLRLILFPDEGNQIVQFQNQKRKMQEESFWFDQYLFKVNSQ